jgi:hypothetical protein
MSTRLPPGRSEENKKMTQTTARELEIMTAALPLVESVPMAQDSCWPGDGPAHDDDCTLADHTASAAAVAATEGLSWEFSSWSDTAAWFRSAIEGC